MKKINFKNLLYKLAILIQITIIVGVSIVQYLTDKKARVMKHVYYRRYQFESSIFSLENIQIQKFSIIIVSIILIGLFIYLLKKSNAKFLKVQVGLSIIISIILFIVISSSYFVSKLAYHYFIMAFALVLIIQIFVVIITIILKGRN